MEKIDKMENQQPQSMPQIPAEFNHQQAISVLIQAVNFAQTKGIFSLEDAELISKAVKVFVKKEEKKEVETKNGPDMENSTEDISNSVPEIQKN